MSELVEVSRKVIEREDMPASVQEIPLDLDPLAKGILMEHQKTWLEDDSDLKLCEKGRRTGISFDEAFDAMLIASASKSAGGMNYFYIGDTKEKGLEFVGYVAHFASVVAGDFLEIQEVLFQDQRPDGSSRFITSYIVRFASGYRVHALSSRPASIRGLQGVVCIDEAAFHDDVREVLKAVNAMLIWGGRIRIISTHNGELNPFNELVQDIRAGKYPYSLHRYTFDDAVNNGLYERRCLIKGEPVVEAEKQKWYETVRGAYGTDKEAEAEELDAIPSSGSGTYLPRALIESVSKKDIPVITLSLENDFTYQPEHIRKAEINDWCNEQLKPHLSKLNPNYRHYIGEDFARSGDLTVMIPGYDAPNLNLIVPFQVELRNIPFEQQKQIFFYIVKRLPRFTAGALDARGNGQYLAEVAAQEFGSTRIAQVMLSVEWYRTNMPPFKARFEDKTIQIAKHADVVADLRCIKMLNGVAKVPDSVRVKGSDGKDRHGDSAIALCLLEFAVSKMEPAEIDYTAGPAKNREYNPDHDDDDNDFNYEGQGAW